MALELVQALAEGRDFPVADKVAELRSVHERYALGPSTRSIVDAARRRGIPFLRLDDLSLVQLGHGARARRIQATIGSHTSHIAVALAGDKSLTKRILSFHGVPVPEGETVRTWEDALDAAQRLGWPVVVKPLDASQGRGIATDIRSEEELRAAFEEAQRYRTTVVVERHLQGDDFRLLVVGGKLIAAAQRTPAHVVGDGERSIAQLVDEVNADPRRGDGHEKVMTKIRLGDRASRLLASRGMGFDSVPAAGERVLLETTANLSTGGTAVDVTERVHPANLELAERIACLVDLDIAGIDVVAPSLEEPLEENGGGVVEVNAAPGFRMHLAPTEGKPRPVGEAVVDLLFPRGAEARIPILTVTGTNGKTTTARLCAHIAQMAGRQVGLTTSDGIYIRGRLVQKGDTTGPASAAVVLRDPGVDFAVLETARGGIVRSGLGYDWADAAILTNVAGDHLGLRDVNTLEDLADVKGVTLERVRKGGHAILDAADSMTPYLRPRIAAKLALFALDPANETFREHVRDGGVGATVEERTLVLYESGVRVRICGIEEVPITFGGRAGFNIANALAALLGAHATGFTTSEIVGGLRSFHQSAWQTPGRINFFQGDGFKVVVDYAHNPHAIAALCRFVDALRERELIMVLGLPGDRRNEDMRACARLAAATFDQIVLRDDLDLRGREPAETPTLLREELLSVGFPAEKIRTCLDERAAVDVALSSARPGDLVVYIADKPAKTAVWVEEWLAARRAAAPAEHPNGSTEWTPLHDDGWRDHARHVNGHETAELGDGFSGGVQPSRRERLI
jgi:cyanophycin synthetase